MTRFACAPQAIFAVVSPGKIMPNLVAGAIAEVRSLPPAAICPAAICPSRQSDLCCFVCRRAPSRQAT